MCGCNNKQVKYSDNKAATVEAQYTVPAPKRKLTTSCISIGQCGRIERNEFTTSEGYQAIFARNTGNLGQNFPKEGFSLNTSTSPISSIGLRQLAEELASMADELDGQKTLVTILDATPVKRAYNKKAKKKSSKKAVVKKN